MKKNKKKTKFLSAVERFMYKLCIVIIVLLNVIFDQQNKFCLPLQILLQIS